MQKYPNQPKLDSQLRRSSTILYSLHTIYTYFWMISFPSCSFIENSNVTQTSKTFNLLQIKVTIKLSIYCLTCCMNYEKVARVAPTMPVPFFFKLRKYPNQPFYSHPLTHWPITHLTRDVRFFFYVFMYGISIFNSSYKIKYQQDIVTTTQCGE